MKKIVITLAMALGTPALASHLVCTGPDFYYSNSRVDIGTAPQPGQVVGNTTIVSEGEVLMDKDRISGTGLFSPDDYYLALDAEPMKVLVDTESQAAYLKVWYVSGTLMKRLTPMAGQTEPVKKFNRLLCEKLDLFVP